MEAPIVDVRIYMLKSRINKMRVNEAHARVNFTQSGRVTVWRKKKSIQYLSTLNQLSTSIEDMVYLYIHPELQA